MDASIDDYLELYTEDLLERHDNSENERIKVKELISFLDGTEFWDFRKYNEYPDCLECYEDKNCDYENICPF